MCDYTWRTGEEITEVNKVVLYIGNMSYLIFKNINWKASVLVKTMVACKSVFIYYNTCRSMCVCVEGGVYLYVYVGTSGCSLENRNSEIQKSFSK